MTSAGRRRLSDRDQRRLWGLSRNRCAYPQCRTQLVQRQGDDEAGDHALVGDGAHIRSASPDGPRYDPDYPVEKLETYDNRILLCATHHRLVDANDGAAYSVENLIAMKGRHERSEDSRERVEKAVSSYLADRYLADDKILFSQASLEPRVDELFVDVPASCAAMTPAAALFQHIAQTYPGDAIAPSGSTVVGTAQALLHPEWTGHAILVGGPGQGKSTLLQYVCQFHRARLQQKLDYAPETREIRPVTETVRVPIRIDLKAFAHWIESQEKLKRTRKGKSHRKGKPNLESYLLDHLNEHSGIHEMKARDLATLLETRPTLLALDGLDEIADLGLRIKVADEVTLATGRLVQDSLDVVVLVTTRPGSGHDRVWIDRGFSELRLQRLTDGLRLQFFDRWSDVRRLSAEQAERLRAKYTESQSQSHIRDLAAYPMQLAIVLHLLHTRGHLPQQRTDLYRDYLQTFLDREQHEGKEPLLSTQRTVLEDVHAFLGWYLQKESEAAAEEGVLSRRELEPLITRYLNDRDDDLALARQLFSAIDNRVLCLVQRPLGYFQFEVPSLREYFASVYLFQNTGSSRNSSSRDDCIKALLARPYWLNVFRFMAGQLNKFEVRALPSALQEVLDSASVGQRLHVRRAALRLLDDRVFQGHEAGRKREMVNLALVGGGLALAQMGLLDDTGAPLSLQPDAGGQEVLAHLQDRLPEATSVSEIVLGSRLLRSHNEPSVELSGWWARVSYASPEMWILLGSSLGVLTDPQGAVKTRLRDLIAARQDPEVWSTEWLVPGGYQGASESVIEHCRLEIADGAGELVSSDIPGPLSDLIREARSAMGYRVGSVMVDQAPEPRRRRRRSSACGPPAPEVVFPGDSGTPLAWVKFLEHVEERWGDGWTLRRAVCTMDHQVDAQQVLDVTGGNNSPLLVHLLTEQVDARARQRDALWWRERLQACDGDLERRAWLLRFLTVPHVEVVTGCAADMDVTIRGLARPHFRALDAAVAHLGQMPRARALRANEAVRTGKLDVSARSLWLIRRAAGSGSIDHLEKKLSTDPGDLLAAGLSDHREMARIMRASGRKTPLKALRDTWEHLPAGSLQPEMLRALTAKQAADILNDPYAWPPDVIEMAFHQGSSSIPQLAPLAQISADWFEDEAT